MKRTEAPLTVAQLNAVHARLYALIKDFTVHDEQVTGEHKHSVTHYSPTKAVVYGYIAEVFGHSPALTEELNNGELPTNGKIQPMPETVAELIRRLSSQELRQLADEDRSPVVPVNSVPFKMRAAADMWYTVTQQVIAELPQILGQQQREGRT